ncbi:MAG TPA: hypothetical protein VGI64_14065 [Streptosporangiaceae bacterium]
MRRFIVAKAPGISLTQVTFPARDQLPPGVYIEKLQLLGTSWYDRGPGYWLRRVWLFLLMALLVTLTSLLIGGFMAGIKDSSQAGFVGVLIAEIAWSLAILVFLLIRTSRQWNVPEPARPLSRKQRRAVATGSTIGSLARAGFVLGQAILVIGSLLFFGLYLMLLVYALLPEWPPEHKARLRLAQQLAAHESATAS